MLRAPIAFLLAIVAVVTALSCGGGDFGQDGQGDLEARQATVVSALDALAKDLLTDRPADAAGYSHRMEAYLEANPGFFGGAAALLDGSGAVTTCPYLYRTDDGYATVDLATPSYNIREQEWFTAPLSANAGVWTAPYFDAGGGDVWMITRSVPLHDSNGVFAIITTDLVVDAPSE